MITMIEMFSGATIVLQSLFLILFTIGIVKIFLFIRFHAIFRKFPRQKGHFILGDVPIRLINFNIFRSKFQNYTLLLEDAIPILTNKDRRNSFLVRWLGLYPIIDCISHRSASVLLSSKQNLDKGRFYDLFTKWLGEGLLISKPNKWKHRRKLILPAFTAKNLKNFVPTMERHCKEMIETIGQQSSDTIKLESLCFETVLVIVCETILGLPANSVRSIGSQFIQATNRLTRISINRLLNPILWFDSTFDHTSIGFHFNENIHIFRALSQDIIRNRMDKMKTKQHQHDSSSSGKPLIDILLEEYMKPVDSHSQANIDLEGIQDEIQNFVYAGYETTASTLTRTLWLLGLYPEIQDRLYREIKSMSFEDYCHDTLDQLESLNYLDCCIKETMRLFPTVPTIARQLDESIDLDGHSIPSGTVVGINLHAVHHDPSVFDNPDQYNPDRFDRSSALGSKDIPRYAFIPFSGGPRVCIGQKFATIIMKLLIYHIVKNFELKSLQPMENMKFEFQITIKPVEPFKLTLKPRRNHTLMPLISSQSSSSSL